MGVIGRKFNFIRLHDFLDRMEVEQVYSSLHMFYPSLTSGVGPDEEIEWSGHRYTKLTLLATMRQEDGILSAILFKEHPSRNYEVDLQFTSGNEIVIKIKDQRQYFEILDFLINYD